MREVKTKKLQRRQGWSIWEPYRKEIEGYVDIGVNVKSIYLLIVDKMRRENSITKPPVLDGLYKWLKRKKE